MELQNVIKFINNTEFLAEKDYYEYYGVILQRFNNNIKLYNKLDLFHTCINDVSDPIDIDIYCVIYYNLMDRTDKGFNILRYLIDKQNNELMKVSCKCSSMIRMMMDNIKDKFYDKGEFTHLTEHLLKLDYNSEYTLYHALNLIAKSVIYSDQEDMIARVNEYMPKYLDVAEYNKLEETFSKISRDVYVTSYTEQVIMEKPVEIKALIDIGTATLADYQRRSTSLFESNYKRVKDFIIGMQHRYEVGLEGNKLYGTNTCILLLALKYSNHFDLLDSIEIIVAYNRYLNNYDYYEFTQDLDKAVELMNLADEDEGEEIDYEEIDEEEEEIHEGEEIFTVMNSLILLGDILSTFIEYMKFELSRKLIRYSDESSIENFYALNNLFDESPSGTADIEIIQRLYRQKYVEVRG